MKYRILFLLIVSVITNFGVAQTYFGNPKSTVYDFSLSSNGDFLAVPIGFNVEVWAIDPPKQVSIFKNPHKRLISSVDFSNSDSLIVVGDKEGYVTVWNTKNESPIMELKIHDGHILSVQFGFDDDLLISGGTDNNIYISSIEKKGVLKLLQGHKDDILDIESINDRLIASSSADGSIIIWDIVSGNKLNQWQAHSNWTRDISIGEDQCKILSCSDDGRVKIWDISNLESIKLIHDEKMSTNWLTAVSCADDKIFAFAGHSGDVEIISPRVQYILSTNHYINKIAFLPNQFFIKLIIATVGGGVYSYDTREMKMIYK